MLASTVAAAGARVSSGSRLQRPWRCGVGTYGFYAVRRVRWTHARDRMVTEASPASSSCGGASRLRWRRRLELEIGHAVRGKRSRGSHLVGREAQQARGGPGGSVTAMAIRRPCAEKTGRWRGSRASSGAWLVGDEEEVVAELPDSTVERGVAGEHGGSEQRRRLLSALGERAREARQGERGAVEGVQGAAWRRLVHREGAR